MPGNSFGKALVLTTFGESHGPAAGGVLDGFPSNIPVDLHFIQSELDRRRTKSWFYASPRIEEDKIEILSGIFENKSTGAPIAFIIRNKDARPADYEQLKDIYRPSHADFTWEKKYGIRDYLGGGRSSARETVARVAGGAFAKLLLATQDISFLSYVSQIGTVRLPDDFELINPGSILKSPVLCPDEEISRQMVTLLENLKAEGDTTGGIVNCTISGVPVGLGEPVFDKLQADLAKAMLSINAVKGFEYGTGFRAASKKGSEHNDPFIFKDNRITTSTNNSGGIQGGISNGNDIYFRVAFKPPPTLMRDQKTVNSRGEKVILKGKGRHDVCMVPRTLPIVEAMAALVLADHLLRTART
jgi:chorismate synthase